jgi:hypothetical protein
MNDGAGTLAWFCSITFARKLSPNDFGKARRD